MSAIQGIEGVISQLQATAMSARAQESLPQPTISFAGQLHAALDRISDTQTAARTQAEKFTLGETRRGVKRCDDRYAKKPQFLCKWGFRCVISWWRRIRK